MSKIEGQKSPKGFVEVKRIVTKNAIYQEFLPVKKKKQKIRR